MNLNFNNKTFQELYRCFKATLKVVSYKLLLLPNYNMQDSLDVLHLYYKAAFLVFALFLISLINYSFPTHVAVAFMFYFPLK